MDEILRGAAMKGGGLWLKDFQVEERHEKNSG